MIEFRCTRQYPYNTPGCPGRTQVSDRQGYYKKGNTAFDVYHQMCEQFPMDVQMGFGFDVQKWDWSPQHGKVLTPLPIES